MSKKETNPKPPSNRPPPPPPPPPATPRFKKVKIDLELVLGQNFEKLTEDEICNKVQDAIDKGRDLALGKTDEIPEYATVDEIIAR